jgi:hypothetical protein
MADGAATGGGIPPGGSAFSSWSTKLSSLTSAAQSFGTTTAEKLQSVGTQISNAAAQYVAQQELSNSTYQQPVNIQDAAGRRVRLRPKPAAVGQIIGTSGLLQPLLSTNGMVFPYQPTITYQQDVQYQSIELVHTNQDFYTYSRTPALKLTVDGEFSIQSQKEGLYALACIHFMRTVTKMWFGGSTGSTQALAGTPPPVLLFDGFGEYMFNALPVIVTQFSVSLPKDVDYVPVYGDASSTSVPTADKISQDIAAINQQNIKNSNGCAWLPALFTIQMQLTVQNTPQRLRSFDLDQFRTGELLKKGSWV